MSWTIDQALSETNVPFMNVVSGELSPTFSLASNATFEQVEGGTDDAPQYYDITFGSYQIGESKNAHRSASRIVETSSDSAVVNVGTADPFDIFKKILVVTQVDEDWLEFCELSRDWKQHRKNISMMAADPRDPHYLRIIGMGRRAIPCILRQLRNEMLAGEPDHWFTALWAITGENPVPEVSQGRIREMARAWLAWGDRRGQRDAEGVGAGISASR
jgi:hypothetical protein